MHQRIAKAVGESAEPDGGVGRQIAVRLRPDAVALEGRGRGLGGGLTRNSNRDRRDSDTDRNARS
jgi:hypothetical protein